MVNQVAKINGKGACHDDVPFSLFALPSLFLSSNCALCVNYGNTIMCDVLLLIIPTEPSYVMNQLEQNGKVAGATVLVGGPNNNTSGGGGGDESNASTSSSQWWQLEEFANNLITQVSHNRYTCIWFKYDLGQKYYAPQVRPNWGSNS